MHVESVAWISERKDVLCAFFVLIGLLAYQRYVRRPGSLRYGCVLGCQALALMCKPMAVTFPFVLLLLDYWPLERLKNSYPADVNKVSLARLLLEKVPFILLTGLFCWISLAAQQKNMAMSDLAIIPLELRVKNALVSYVDYLRLAFYPSGLNALYPYPFDISTVYALGCAVFLLALLLVALLRARQAPYLPVGLLWFLGMLLPVIGIVQVGMQAKADRYVYLPYIGLYIAVVWTISSIVTRFPKVRAAVVVIFVLALGLLVNTTHHQVRTWKDGATLFERMLDVNPYNKIALYNLGGFLYTQERYAEAADVLERYFKMDHWKPEVLKLLTDSYVELERYQDAMTYMKYLANVQPEDSDILAKLAYISLMCGEVDYSVKALQAANTFEPNDTRKQERVSTFVSMLLDKASKAAADQREVYIDGAIALAPYDARTLYAQAQLKVHQRKLADAVVCLILAKRQAPESKPVLGLMRKLLSNMDTSENALVLRQIAWALATNPEKARRDGESALEFAVRAIELQGGETALTADALAAALAESGHFNEAQRTAGRAAVLAKQGGDECYAAEIAARQSLYASGKAFHIAR